MPTQVEGRDNGRTAWCYRQPLGVECAGCGHRGLVPLERMGATTGDMRALIDRPFKCSACGSMFVGLWLFATRDEADSWVTSRLVGASQACRA